MSYWKFDPNGDLTNEQITQILRELISTVHDDQKLGIDSTMPAISEFMVEVDE